MQHEHFPCKFPSKVVAVAKIYTFHSKTGVGAANVKSCTLTVNLQVKSSCCMSCCMCVACVLHVCCMCVAWQVCRIEQSRSQSGAPATQNDSQCTQRHCRIRSKRCQDKTVTACISLSTTHISTYAPAQANSASTPTHKHPPKLIPMLSLTQWRHHSRVCLQPWVHPIVSFLSPGSSKKTAIPWSTTPQRSCPPRPPLQCCLLNFVFGGLQKKQPFLLMMLGTFDHNIEVGGCGGKQGISVVSCGWLFFLKNPVRFFWVPSSF